LIYYGNQQQLEYDFVVAPGADPHCIRFDVCGANRVADKEGNLMLQTSAGTVALHKPVLYQIALGKKLQIQGHYVLRHGRQVEFEVGAYDSRKPLIIDPAVSGSALRSMVPGMLTLPEVRDHNSFLRRREHFRRHATPETAALLQPS
jgi:hypothetical protein